METSLHHQLKQAYARDDTRVEVAVDGYRVDAVASGRLIEVQHGSLSAIRDKVRKLLKDHSVLVVKPIVARRQLVNCDRKGGRVIGRRLSPKRGTVLDLFDDLVYFTRVFPHPNLVMEVPLVDIEEWRYPGHGRRRRRRQRDYQVEDQKLIKVQEVFRFHTAADLRQIVPTNLPSPFHTGQLATALGIQRWVAQKIAYCLRRVGTARQVGKQGNALLYKFPGKTTTPLRPSSSPLATRD